VGREQALIVGQLEILQAPRADPELGQDGIVTITHPDLGAELELTGKIQQVL
jgi:hypothetical protein